MNFPVEIWAEKRNKGLFHYLPVHGIDFTGGAFPVVMQIIGVFLLREEGHTIGQYFTAPLTWLTFLLHGTLFGSIVGYIKWRRNEAAFAEASKGE